MTQTDIYSKLIRHYENSTTFPNRERFVKAVRETFSEDEVKIFFMAPFSGTIPIERLAKKTEKIGITSDELPATVKRLCCEGLLVSARKEDGVYVGRGQLISLIELQVRKPKGSAIREASLEYMNASIDGLTPPSPTKTPYYRVLPMETALVKTQEGESIVLDRLVPDPREILPLDVVSHMIKDEELIVLSTCYCRIARKEAGKACEHDLETCFFFGELALFILESGQGRKIDYDEAMSVLRKCEEQGLVHNISNAKTGPETLCNCCGCNCAVLNAKKHGRTNVAAPSRYIIAFEPEKCTLHQACLSICPMDNYTVVDEILVIDYEGCIGCGLCVAACPENALHLEIREEQAKIPKDNHQLWNQITIEGVIGSTIGKFLGRG
jgi:Fe-S-cluster-containing hydrogenase component 2